MSEAQSEATRRYQAARAAWVNSRDIRDTGALLSVSERAYCELYVGLYYDPLPGDVPPDMERAYREARP